MLLFCLSHSFAQNGQERKLQCAILAAFNKAYPASVRVWGFDTIRNERTSAQFSAVVVSADGYILTAAHTVEPGKTYKVFFTNGKEAIARALGKIEVKETPGAPDMGMMKIVTPGKWPYAQMGQSDQLKADELALSISYPESLNQPLPSLRVGKIAEQKNEYGFIRSTCKMEPGDSGGPLFDGKGMVIGLHSAIDVAEDMNFEVPVDLYRKYWTALMQPVVYTAWPNHRDKYETLPLPEAKINYADLSTNYKPKFKNTCLMVSSTADQNKKMIQATLFNVIGMGGGTKQVLLSKNSMVGNTPQLRFENKELDLRIISRDQVNDLVLMSMTAKIPGGINLKLNQTEVHHSKIGALLFSVFDGGKAVQSVMSTDGFSLPKKASLPYLGAMVVYNSSPAVFSLIKESSPAAAAGIQVGDELISINEKEIKTAADFNSAISAYWPDDNLKISYQRDGKTITTSVKLKAQNQATFNHPAEKFIGGKSGRRDGFQTVQAHDLALRPEEAGSPVFDSAGNFVGINIARFSRTSSLLIPVSVVQEFIRNSAAGVIPHI